MNVCDIMKADVPVISHKSTVREAVRLLNSSGLSGLPVVDDDGMLAGIVSEHDVIRSLMPAYDKVISGEATRPDFDFLLESRARDLRDRPVSEIMVRNVVTLSADDPVIKAASTMLLKRLKVLPVVKDGRPIGIVNRLRLAHALIG